MKKVFVNVIVIILSMLLFTPTSLAAMSYSDIGKNHPHYKAIEYVTNKKIMQGPYAGGMGDSIFYTAGIFGPNRTIYKNEAAMYMVNALKLRNESYTDPGYTDVKEGDLLYKYVAIASNNGLFKQTTKFKPDANITRAEAAYMIVEGFNLKGTSKHKFADVSTSSSYNNAIQALVANGITANSDKFNPNEAITRAQFATFLTRAMEPSYRVKTSNTSGSKNTINYKDGLVPSSLNKSYTFRERYERENNYHVFNKLTNKVSADKLSRKVTMRGYNKNTETTSSIVYYEDAKRFKVSIEMPYTSGLIDMNYPLKAGSTTTKYLADPYNDGEIKHVFTVKSTTANKTVEGKKYSNVVVIEHQFYYEGSTYPMEATYYLVKNIGLIAFDTEVGSFTLVPKK